MISNKPIMYPSKKKQNFVKFSFKMLQKYKSITLLTFQIINYAPHKIFLHVKVFRLIVVHWFDYLKHK